MDDLGTDQPAGVATGGERPPQLELFDGLLPSTRHPYINSFALYDLAPKHVYTVTEADYLQRDGQPVKGVLTIKSRQFMLDEITYEVTISPAKLKVGGQQIEAYPGHQEQVVEEALRRIAIRKRRTSLVDGEPGVRFTLYELRQELKALGSTMSLQEIKRSIEICSKCVISIQRVGETNPDFQSPIFPVRVLAKRLDDGDTISYVTFHPLVAGAIMRMEYRLLNLETSVKFRSYVTRWLHKRLTHRYTNASISGNGYNILATTIIRDSGMTPYKQHRDSIRKVREAVSELKEHGILLTYTSEDIKDSRGKLEDVKFVLTPSVEFVDEMKKANWHQGQLAIEAEKRGLKVVRGGKASR